MSKRAGPFRPLGLAALPAGCAPPRPNADSPCDAAPPLDASRTVLDASPFAPDGHEEPERDAGGGDVDDAGLGSRLAEDLRLRGPRTLALGRTFSCAVLGDWALRCLGAVPHGEATTPLLRLGPPYADSVRARGEAFCVTTLNERELRCWGSVPLDGSTTLLFGPPAHGLRGVVSVALSESTTF